MSHRPVVIVGAGLAGSLLGIYLGRRGFRVEIYERRPDMRQTEISAGRSINLALSTRGIHALHEAGVLNEIMRDAIPMRGRMIHALDGSLAFQPYGKNEQEVIHSISRGGLNATLMSAAEDTGQVKIYFNHRCMGIDLPTGQLFFQNEMTGRALTVLPEVTFACDGAYSAVRLEMQKAGRFNFSQEYLAHGYKELTIPAAPGGEFVMEKHALHIWPRGTYMLIALPNPDGSFTCTLFLPFEGETSFANLQQREQVAQFFGEHFPDAVPQMPTLLRDFFAHPTGELVTIRCYPWFVNDKALLLGDAAHAIVPFYGQGMNCAFEDCSVLNGCLERHGANWTRVFAEYQELRKPNTDAIAQLAIDNFVEMRDRVADPDFLKKKKLELLLETAFPGEFLSTYARVTFHRRPYAEALEKGKIQDRVLMEICREADSLDDVILQDVMAILEANFKKAGLQ